MSAQMRCPQITRTKTTNCDFCKVQIDGTIYRVGIFRYHKVCVEVQNDPKRPSQGTLGPFHAVSRDGPFRMRTFSGDPDLRLMQGRQPWRRVA